MRRFLLHRIEDETGVSGEGIVAEGVEFLDGKVTLRWCVGEWRSTVVWDDIDAVEKIHGHNGKTVILWLDDEHPKATTRRARAILALARQVGVKR